MLSASQKKQILYASIGFFILLVGIFIYFFLIKGKPNLVMVSGTEYISGEEGQIIIRLQDSRNNPITNANCKVSLLYPDKTFFILERDMQATSVPGNYYISFTTPESEGIYEEHIRCDINGRIRFISSSFHVSTGLNLVAKIFEKQQEQYQKIIEDFIITQELLQSNIGNVSERLDNVELRLNQSIDENQRDMLDKWTRMGRAMAEIFGNSS
jgi:hypothetical protein